MDFEGRVTCGLSVFPDEDPCRDGFGHGTHVAGIVGGSTYGVAKEVELVSVQVLNDQGEGSLSGMLLGLEYVLDQKLASPETPMIVNFSVSGRHHPLLDEAVEQAVQAGIPVIAAAGNHNKSACQYSPGSSEYAITVGAINQRDAVLGFSNYGECVDILAPGGNIVSADSTSDAGERAQTGTSQAAPHVTGVVALYFEEHPTWTPEDVREAMRTAAVNELRGLNTGKSPNLILQTPA